MIETVLSLSLDQIKNLSVIIGIIIALLTYVTNSYFQIRNKRIENLQRYFDAHDRLFLDDGFIATNIKELEDDTYSRDLNNKDMERKLNRLFGDVEKIAYLTSHNAVPVTLQVYMFGWFAQKIYPHITNDERQNIFWELAIHYIEELKKAAEDYSKLDHKRREKYLKKNALVYKRYS